MTKVWCLIATICASFACAMPIPAFAAEQTAASHTLDLTGTWYGIAAVVVFVIAYVLVIGEEFMHLRKSKPVMVAVGIIWGLIAFGYVQHGDTKTDAHQFQQYSISCHTQALARILFFFSRGEQHRCVRLW